MSNISDISFTYHFKLAKSINTQLNEKIHFELLNVFEMHYLNIKFTKNYEVIPMQA